MLGRESARRRALHVSGVILAFGFVSSSASAGVLIFGDRPEFRAALAADLTSLGETVTNMASLPADLTAYNVIWHVSAFTALSPGEQADLAAFVDSGRGLHLSGEQCCQGMNDSVGNVINTLVAGGGIQVGNNGTPVGPYTFNSPAVQNVTSAPNLLSSWTPTVPGAMSGTVPAHAVLATSMSGKVMGMAWDEGLMTNGRGRVSILMDVDWFSSANRLTVVENLQTFLNVPEPATLVFLAVTTLLMPRPRRRSFAD